MNWVNYLIQINIYLTVGFLIYVAILRSETFFTLNRIYLLIMSVLCLAIPFVQFDVIKNLELTKQTLRLIYASQLPDYIISQKAATYTWNWHTLWISIYFIGFTYYLLKMSVSLIKLQKLLQMRLPEGSAYSVFGKIRIDKKLANYEVIKSHEEVHSKEFHSLDIFFFEIMSIIYWFNPIIPWLKSEIRNLHEYIADGKAALHLGSKKSYAEVLVLSHFKASPNVFVNNFYNKSSLKIRILMLQKQQSGPLALIKYLLILPFVLGVLIFSTANNPPAVQTNAPTIIKT